MNVAITFTPDALADNALQDVMILMHDRSFRVEFAVDDPDNDEVQLKGVVGRVTGASNTELTIAHASMKYHIPWDDIRVLEYQ